MNNLCKINYFLFALIIMSPFTAIDIQIPSRDKHSFEIKEKSSNISNIINTTSTTGKGNFSITRLNNFPLRFESNAGQFANSVKFCARGINYKLYLTQNDLIVHLPGNFQDAAEPRKDSSESVFMAKNINNNYFTIKFDGCNKNSILEGISPLTTKVNYLLGNKKDKWFHDVPTYAKVKYHKIYEGIDLIFYGNQNKIEYDFVLSPGADYKLISLKVEGAEKIEITNDGSLRIVKRNEILLMKSPFMYQISDDSKNRLSGGYVLRDKNQIGIRLNSYDPELPVIIDPVIIFSSYLGGSNNDIAYDIALDNQKNIYITGETISSDFPVKDALQPTRGGGWGDIFVTKINPSGSEIIFSTFLGGSKSDTGNGITVDENGNIYIIGNTSSTDFPIKNAVQPNIGDTTWSDAFITMLNNSGSNIIFSTYLGGNNNEMGNAISAAKDGSIVVTGLTCSNNFPVVNAFQNNLSGGIFPQDIFVTKLSANGATVVYSTYLGSSSTLSEVGRDVAIDSKNNAVITGYTGAGEFPLIKPYQNKLGGSYDVFVTKFSPDGTPLFSTFLGGTQIDQGKGIAIDKDDNIYITGGTNSADFPTKNPIQTKGGLFDFDVFVTKMSPDGQLLMYSTYLAGTDSDVGNDIAVDAAGNAYITGYTTSHDFNTVNSMQGYNAGIYPPYREDAFAAKINNTGTEFVYSTYIGGNQDDTGNGISVDDRGDVYITGKTRSNTDFPVKSPFQEHFGGSMCGEFPCPDGFLIKITSTVLASPENLKAEVSGQNVTLKWNPPASPNLSSYNIYRSPTSPVFCSILNKIGSCNANETSYKDKIISSGPNYYYVLTAVYAEGESAPSNEASVSFTEVGLLNSIIPPEFKLLQNYPNPFNPVTTIEYTIPKSQKVVLRIYEANGRTLLTLVNQFQSLGNYRVRLDGSTLASGVYFYELRTGEFRSVKKLLLLK